MKDCVNNIAKTRRQKIILVCLVVSCVLVYLLWFAQASGVINLTGYRMAVRTDQAVQDFGKVKAGSVVSHTFILKNISKDIINIKKLVSSCACTAAVLSEKQLEPGQEADIEIVLRTTGYMGELRQKCLVLFEQEDVVPITLEVVANIYSPTANFSVNRLYFGKVVTGTEALKKITIFEKEYLDERIIIDDVKVSSDFIKAYYDKEEGEIQCIIDSKTPVGVINEKIFVNVTSPSGISNIEIPVGGRVVKPYEVNPERIFLGHVNRDQNQPIIKIITITNLKEEIPSDFQPVIENENIRIRVESRDVNSLVCSLEFVPPAESSFFKDELILKISDGDMNDVEVLRIPYSGFCVAN